LGSDDVFYLLEYQNWQAKEKERTKNLRGEKRKREVCFSESIQEEKAFLFIGRQILIIILFPAIKMIDKK